MSSATYETGSPREPFRPQPRTSTMSNSDRGEPIEILLVEDSPDDADLTIDALRDGRVRNRITHLEDGVDALAFLRREGRFHDAPRPDLILLDLGLPRAASARFWPRSSRVPTCGRARSSS